MIKKKINNLRSQFRNYDIDGYIVPQTPQDELVIKFLLIFPISKLLVFEIAASTVLFIL